LRVSLALLGVFWPSVTRVVWRSPRGQGWCPQRMLRSIAVHVSGDDSDTGADTIRPASVVALSRPVKGVLRRRSPLTARATPVRALQRVSDAILRDRVENGARDRRTAARPGRKGGNQ